MRTVYTTALRLQRRWQRPVLLSIGLLAFLFLLPMLATSAWMWPAAITALAVGGGVAATRRDRRRPGGGVVLTPTGIELLLPGRKRPLAITRGEVETAYAVPRHRWVEIRLSGARTLVIETDDPSSILEHLGQAMGQGALTMPLRGVIGAPVLGMSTAMVGFLVFSFVFGQLLQTLWLDLLLSFVGAAASTVFMVRRFGHPRIVVGADGVRVRGTVAQPFVPYAEILNVTPHPMGVQIWLRGGRFLQLETFGQSPDQIASLAANIRQGRDACAAEVSGKLDALGRGARSLQAWQDDIRRIALAPPGFRDQAYSRDDFERIVADPSSPPEHRVGAALALRLADPAARPRIRVAAAATANEDLRAALEACASEEELVDQEPLQRATTQRR